MQMTWICDIDGTVAIMGDRGPFDWKRVGEDTPNEPVVRIIRALQHTGDLIVFMSGRMEQSRTLTEEWLHDNVGYPFHCGLFMRKDGDYRADSIVKRELFETHVQPFHRHIAGVIDDRASVVEMWRDLGLTVLDVAGHDF